MSGCQADLARLAVRVYLVDPSAVLFDPDEPQGFFDSLDAFLGNFKPQLLRKAFARCFSPDSAQRTDQRNLNGVLKEVLAELREQLLDCMVEDHAHTQQAKSLQRKDFVGKSGRLRKKAPEQFTRIVQFFEQDYGGGGPACLGGVDAKDLWQRLHQELRPQVRGAGNDIVRAVVRSTAREVARAFIDSCLPGPDEAAMLCDATGSFLRSGTWQGDPAHDPGSLEGLVDNVLKHGPQQWLGLGLECLGLPPEDAGLEDCVRQIWEAVREYLSSDNGVGLDVGEGKDFDRLVACVDLLLREHCGPRHDALRMIVAICLLGPGSLSTSALSAEDRRSLRDVADELEGIAQLVRTKPAAQIRECAKKAGGATGQVLRKIANEVEKRGHISAAAGEQVREIARQLRRATATFVGADIPPPVAMCRYPLLILRAMVPTLAARSQIPQPRSQVAKRQLRRQVPKPELQLQEPTLDPASERVMEFAAAYGCGQWRRWPTAARGWSGTWQGAVSALGRAIKPYLRQVQEHLKDPVVVDFFPSPDVEADAIRIAMNLHRPLQQLPLAASEQIIVGCTDTDTRMRFGSVLSEPVPPGAKLVFTIPAAAPLGLYRYRFQINRDQQVIVSSAAASTTVATEGGEPVRLWEKEEVRLGEPDLRGSREVTLRENEEVWLLPALAGWSLDPPPQDPMSLVVLDGGANLARWAHQAIRIRRSAGETLIVVDGSDFVIVPPGQRVGLVVEHPAALVSAYQPQRPIDQDAKVVVSAWDLAATIRIEVQGEAEPREITLKAWEDARFFAENDWAVQLWSCLCGTEKCPQRHRLTSWDPRSLRLWAYLASAAKGPAVKIMANCIVQGMYYPLLARGDVA